MFYIAPKDAEEIEKIMFKINTSNILILMGSIPFIFLMVLSLFSLDNFFNYSIELFSINIFYNYNKFYLWNPLGYIS